MKFLKYFLLILLLIFLTGLGIGISLPSDWRVTRSITINTPPTAIFPYISNFKSGWSSWSTLDFKDPEIEYHYSGPEMGSGAKRNWISKKIGNGSQRITKANDGGVSFIIDMQKTEFEILGEITLNSTPPNTIVTWTDVGNFGANPFYKIMGALMDKFMGKEFESSLSKLKNLSEESFQNAKNSQN